VLGGGGGHGGASTRTMYRALVDEGAQGLADHATGHTETLPQGGLTGQRLTRWDGPVPDLRAKDIGDLGVQGARIGSVDGHGRHSRSCAKCPRDDGRRPLTPSPRQTRKGTSHPRFRKKEQGRGAAEPPLRPYRSPRELQERGPVTCHTYFHSGASSAARRIARTRLASRAMP